MFVSYSFVAFILVLFLLYYLVPKACQWPLLLIANFLFYFSAGKFYPVFILITSATVYITGLLMKKQESVLADYDARIKAGEIAKPSREEKKAYKNKINKKKKTYMLLCLFLNLGILAVTKYTNFIIFNVDSLFHARFSLVDMIVPLGISFYTFQAVSYLLDVYWEKCEVQTNFFKFTLFVSFFPQLIQGPISRYSDLSKSLYAKHSFDWETVRFGLERILWGYFKKLVIADRISVAVIAIMDEPDVYSGLYVAIGAFFYAIQLYADFTGGIDITIGIAQVFGIQLQENFIRPYFSKNIIEYWRRWHISMGTWFRDYVFYPCSISKPMKNITKWTKKHFGMGAARRVAVYIATFLTWFATGIWHGADWHFIVWGIMNGLIIFATGELEPCYEVFRKKFPKLYGSYFWKMFQVVRTFLLMCCLRMFDTYASVTVAFKQLFNMFLKMGSVRVTMTDLIDLGLTGADYIIVFCGVLLMFLFSMLQRSGSVRKKLSKQPYIIRFCVITGLFFAVLLFGRYGLDVDASQFIYNQF